MLKDALRLSLVMMLDSVGYNPDVMAQRFEMAIAIWGALPLINTFF